MRNAGVGVVRPPGFSAHRCIRPGRPGGILGISTESFTKCFNPSGWKIGVWAWRLQIGNIQIYKKEQLESVLLAVVCPGRRGDANGGKYGADSPRGDSQPCGEGLFAWHQTRGDLRVVSQPLRRVHGCGGKILKGPPCSSPRAITGFRHVSSSQACCARKGAWKFARPARSKEVLFLTDVLMYPSHPSVRSGP